MCDFAESQNLRAVVYAVGFLTACLASAGESVSLNGAWELSWRHQEERGAWRTIPAQVPGDALAELERAGILPDLTVGTNVWSTFPWEQCEWRYARMFAVPCVASGERVRLRFDGVDTRAEYFLNGTRLGSSENMFVPASFDVTDRLRPTNRLEVVIHSPLGRPILGVLGRSRVGGTDVEGIRKAQHAFGWDIMPRVVSCGIWRGVFLDRVPPVRFGDVHWMVRSANHQARTASGLVDCQILAPLRYLHRARLRLSLTRGGRVAWHTEHVVRYYQTRDGFGVRNADLWWPRDAGEPALYDAVAEFVDADGTVLARDVRKVGLRTVRLERADWYSEENPGTFRFLVNGVPIYMHGTDWTPMDALHSRDGAHLARCLDMLVDLNCNMIRIWGGGVYEPDALYDFCDAHGICVWQDFMMGNVEPEQNDDFAARIASEAKDVVLRLRSHPCLALWCANNEIDRSVASNWGAWTPDPAGERISRETLPRVLRDFDPLTPYIPSSPWWTPDVVAGRAKLSQDHLWGPRQRFFKDPFWTNATPTFVSETGYHGCPNADSLRRMMTSTNVYPWPDPANPFRFNDEWNCKAVTSWPEQLDGMGNGRNCLMPNQVKNFFGSVSTNLEEFVDQSQFAQAEALHYWIARSRARKGRTWGMLWWNLRDGWPVISDGVVDYYYGKKRAYNVIKSIQQPQLATLVDYGRLVAVNDRLHSVKGRVKATDLASGKVVYDAVAEVPANGTCTLAENLPLGAQGCLRVDYTFEDTPRVNLCLYGAPPFDYAQVKAWFNGVQ